MQYHQPSPTHHDHQLSLSTQSTLIDSFHCYQVPEFYQNVFINHIKNQQAMVAELSMREEIQALANNTSYIQSFMKYCKQKEKCERYVRQVMSYTKKSYESQNERLVKTCELVGYLRNLNYKCAYFLVKIREKYEQNVDINRSNEKYYYNGFAMKLDSFRKELLKTEIGKYIEFQPQYDSFFMNLRLKQCHSDKQCNEALQMLMEFAVQDSYKYLKMGKLLMDWIFMHTRKREVDKNLDRIQLPELRHNQQYVQYDKLKEEMVRDKLRDKVDSSSNQIKKDRGILDIYNEQTGYGRNINRVYNQDNEIVSLEKYEKQRRRREKQKQRQNYVDDSLNKLLDKNMVTPPNPIKSHIRIKSESTSYDPDFSMIGKIRRYKVSRISEIRNSPHTYDSKRSETLPILLRDDSYNDYCRNAKTRAIVSPKDEYDRRYDYREERQRSLGREKIKLQQINAYQITIGKPNEIAPTVRKQLKRNERLNQPVNNDKTSQRTNAKQTQTNRYEQKQSMPIKKQNDPEKNQSLKKKSIVQQNPNVVSAVTKPANQTRTIEQKKPIQEQKPLTKKEPEKTIQKTPQSQPIKSETTKNPTQQTKPPKKQQSKVKSQKQNENKQERRQIKMKIGKYTLQNFRQYFDNYQIHKDYVKLYDKEKLSKELQFQQTYILQFLINNEPGALAIIYLIANSKFVLRLWALDQKQEATLSYPLLKKMLEYLQKSATNQIMYYKGGQFAELIKAGFIKKKEELYERKRTTDPKQIDLQFQQCLSARCSHIKFVQKQKEDILVSAEIQNFTVENSKMANCLLSINEADIPQKLKKLITIKHKIDGFKSLNKLLQKQELDTYQASSKIVVQSIDLSFFNLGSNFKDSFSVADGFIKFYGNVVKQSQKQTICSIKLSKNNGRICFCKGYKSALQAEKDLKPQTQKKVQFWVPMFNKKLYGRFKNYKSTSSEVCYANWDFSISWEDEIQGALRYIKKLGVTFEQCAFYVCIELQGTLFYSFGVNEDDYIL